MSSRRPSRSNKANGTTKPRRQSRSILRVPSTIPSRSTPTPAHVVSAHSAPIQVPSPDIVSTPSPTVVPTPHLTIVSPPSTFIPQSFHIRPSPVVTPLLTPCIPSPSSIPFLDIAHRSNAPNLAVDEVDHPFHDRSMIEPYGRGFLSSRVASQAITKSIKQQFLKPWLSWGVIPPEDKDQFWQRFKVQWKPEHEAQIQNNFHNKASHRLSQMFRDARVAKKCPYWIEEHIWNSLLAHWSSPDYHNKCAITQTNTTSKKGKTLHIGGFFTTHEHDTGVGT